MVRPVIATKLYVPRTRPGLITRPRLTEQLRRGADVSVTLISAPAGFGKTTLLADWLSATSDRDRRVAWLSLDAADNQPAAFWVYVATALESAVPSIGPTAAEHLGSSPVPMDRLLSTLLNALAETQDEIWLILDDYHLVDDHDVGEAMTFFLEHLPAHVHIVLSTRADPDLPLARWRVRGELVEIRAADLRFTPEEAAAYLAATGLDLAAEDVAVLEERTEGWIAALQLAALSLQGRSDVSSFITGFAGDDRYIVDYLVEEVLAHQPEPVRDFMLQSAVLDRLTGPLCDAVTGREDGSEMILGLERANLFVVALDDQRKWYRYHHLFADVLRARLFSEQPDQVPLLHRRASEWYERHDLVDEAVRHALAARDFDRAAHLAELAVSEIRRRRQEAVMYGWLRALPDDIVRRRPVLSVFYGSMLMAAGDLDAVEPRLADAERVLASVPEHAALPWAETADLLTLPSTIAMYRAALAQARGDAAGTAEHAQRALDLAGPDDHLARGGAAGFLAFAAWARGDVSGALETFTQAVASLHAADNVVDALTGTVVLADLWLAAGRPSRARRLCAQALTVAEKHGPPAARATAELHVGLAELDVEAGDLEGARRHLEAAAALADLFGVNEGRYRWFVARGLLAQADGEPEEAVELFDQAAAHYRSGFYPDVRPIPALKARIWIAEGNLLEADAWARAQGVSVADEVSYLHEFDHLTLVRLLLAQHRAHRDSDALDQAADLSARLHKAAESMPRAGSLLEIGLLQALVHDAQGHPAQARATLTQALTGTPEPDRYQQLFVNEGAPLREVLGAAQSDGVVVDLARRLHSVETPTKITVPSPVQRLERPAGESLSVRELEVLRLLDSELSGPAIARELFLSPNTVRTHTSHIFTKLAVTNRRAAVRRARERGLL